MDLTSHDDWNRLNVDPEVRLAIKSIATHRFDGDLAAALAHVFQRGIRHTPDSDLPSSLVAAGPVFETGLEYTATYGSFLGDPVYGDSNSIPEPFTITVPETEGPPITFGYHFSFLDSEDIGYFQLLNPTETQSLDQSAVMEAMRTIRKLTAVDDTYCRYAVRQNGSNVAGTGVLGFVNALPAGEGAQVPQHDGEWDVSVDPDEPARVAVCIRYASHWMVVRGRYTDDRDELRIESVATPIVHNTKGGTDVCQTICSELLPDIDGLADRIQHIESRPTAATSARLQLGRRTCPELLEPMHMSDDFRFKRPNRTGPHEFIDRCLIENPFRQAGNVSVHDVDVPVGLESIVTGPKQWVFHLRQHAQAANFASYACVVQQIGIQQIGGVANIAAMGKYLEPDQYSETAVVSETSSN